MNWNLLLIFILISANSAFAKPKSFNFECINKFPMTSFLLRTQDKEAILTTIHHNGTAFMPIHEGVIVPNDFNYLKEASNLLTQMGDRNEFRFPIEKCKVYGKDQMSCAQGSTENFNGREMSAFNLTTSNIKESIFGKTFERIKVTLSVHIANYAPVQDISMYYELNECQMSF